jgi:hypothetical protein
VAALPVSQEMKGMNTVHFAGIFKQSIGAIKFATLSTVGNELICIIEEYPKYRRCYYGSGGGIF